MIKEFYLKMLLGCFIFVFSSLNGGASTILANSNGDLASDQKLYGVLVDGTTMVPMRPLLENLGATVIWDGETHSITSKRNDTTVVLTIDDSNALVNGSKVSLEQPAKIINENTMIPVRFVSEAFGLNVKWEEEKRNVIVNDSVIIHISKDINSLLIEFVPASQGDVLLAKLAPLEKILAEKLGVPVEFRLAEEYSDLLDDLSNRKVDMGLFPPQYYNISKQQGFADVLVQGLRPKLGTAGGNQDKKLESSYRGLIITKSGSTITTLQDLKNKKVALQNKSSAAGYIWPMAEITSSGLNPEKDIVSLTVKGQSEAIKAVLDGRVDAAAIFEDARTSILNTNPDVFKQTKVIHYTKPIPNGMISVRSDMENGWRDKITDALIESVQTEQGKIALNQAFGWQGLSKSNDDDFKITKEYIDTAYSIVHRVTTDFKLNEKFLGLEDTLKNTILNYFEVFDDVYKYREFATSKFLKQVYQDCTDDMTDTKSLDQMADELHKINLMSTWLVQYSFKDIQQNDNTVQIIVERQFGNGSINTVTYVIVKNNNDWKFDQIIRY